MMLLPRVQPLLLSVLCVCLCVAGVAANHATRPLRHENAENAQAIVTLVTRAFERDSPVWLDLLLDQAPFSDRAVYMATLVAAFVTALRSSPEQPCEAYDRAVLFTYATHQYSLGRNEPEERGWGRRLCQERGPLPSLMLSHSDIQLLLQHLYMLLPNGPGLVSP